MAGVLRGIILGAGGALGVCSQTDSLSDIPRNILSSALNGYDKIAKTKVDSNSSHSEEVQALAAEIRELKLLNANKSQDKQIIVYGSGSSGSTIVKVIIVGTAGACVCYYFGYGFNDVMYVTKSTLGKAVEQLEENIGFIGTKLEKTKEQLLALIASVEDSVLSSSSELKTQIDEETAKITVKIDDLDDKFEKIHISQSEIRKTTKSLDSQVASLQEKFDMNGIELQKANSGIRLLVNSVVNLPHVRDDQGLYSELKTFLSNNMKWFRSDNKDAPTEEPKKESKSSGLFGMVN